MASRLTALSNHLSSTPCPCGSSGCRGLAPLQCLPVGTAPSGASTPAGADEPPLSVFVLVGQSNMAGRGALDGTPPPSDDILCYSYDDESWAVASEPLHFDPPIAGSEGTIGAGLAWSFAHQLLDQNLVDGKIGLVPCAFGGSPLSRWVEHPDSPEAAPDGPPNPGEPGDLYRRAVRRANEALAAHPHAVLRGFLWHQGESDASDAELAHSYSLRLQGVIAKFRRDVTSDWPVTDQPALASQTACPDCGFVRGAGRTGVRCHPVRHGRAGGVRRARLWRRSALRAQTHREHRAGLRSGLRRRPPAQGG